MKWMALFTALLLVLNSIPYPGLITGYDYDISALEKTSTTPVLFKNEGKFEYAIASVPLLAKCGLQAHAKEPDMGTYILPGMESTLSLNEKGVPSLCGHMTPQGICVTEDYVLITAYCHEKDHNSVLYMMDRNTHRYLKTIVLEGKDHCGSICWDPVYRHVWLSTGHTNHASASYLRIRDMEKYDFAKEAAPLPFTHVEKLNELTRNSFMTWHKGSLYAGTFTLEEPTIRLQRFQIGTAGHLWKRDGHPRIMESMLIASECQGIAMDNKYIYMTFSYGPYRPSTLCIYKKNQKRFLKSDAVKSFTLPPCLEQPYAADGTLYLMWESAAQPFRNEQMTHIDRVIAVNIKKMMKM